MIVGHSRRGLKSICQLSTSSNWQWMITTFWMVNKHVSRQFKGQGENMEANKDEVMN